MINLVEKYLSSDEIIRMSMPSVVKNRIDSVLEIFDLVDNHEKELKSNLFNIIREELPHLNLSFCLHRLFYVDLNGYYDYVKKIMNEEKINLNFPHYVNNGKLKLLRHAFAHPEKNFKEIMKSIRNFQDEENADISDLIRDFNKFNNELKKVLMGIGNKKVIERIKKSDEEYLLNNFPNSKIAKNLKK